MPLPRTRWLAAITALVLVLGVGVAAFRLRLAATDPASAGPRAGADCAPGYQPVDSALAEVRSEVRAEEGDAAESGDEEDDAGELVREATRELPMLAGTD